jgi:hypothetical protein
VRELRVSVLERPDSGRDDVDLVLGEIRRSRVNYTQGVMGLVEQGR